MGVFANTAITDSGRMLLAAAQTGAVFTPTRIVMGSGEMPSGATAKSMTAVVAEVKSLEINKKQRTPDGKVILGGAYSNEDVEQAFYFRELALYAKVVYLNEDGSIASEGAEILYSYGNAGDTADLMPAYSTSTVVEKQIDLVTWIGNETQIDLTIASGLYIPTEEKGEPGGVATLGEDGKVPPEQMPSMEYVKKTGDTMSGALNVGGKVTSNGFALRYSGKEIYSFYTDGQGRGKISDGTNSFNLLDSGNFHEWAMYRHGLGVLPSGTNLNTLSGTNGWYTLRDSFTYENSPAAGAWAILEIRDKAALMIVLNGPMYFCNNLQNGTLAWNKVLVTHGDSTIDGSLSVNHGSGTFVSWNFEAETGAAIDAYLGKKISRLQSICTDAGAEAYLSFFDGTTWLQPLTLLHSGNFSQWAQPAGNYALAGVSDAVVG